MKSLAAPSVSRSGRPEWPIERTEALRRLCAAGLSASQIAKKLGAGTTRNAVAGKANRMGIILRGPPAGSRQHRQLVSDGCRKSWADPAVRERRIAGIRAAFAARRFAKIEATP